MSKNRLPVRLILDELHGRLDPAGKEELDSWLRIPGNEKIYDSVRKLWSGLSERECVSVFRTDTAWQRLHKKISAAHRGKLWKRYAVAVAAAVLVFLIPVSYLVYTYSYRENVVSVVSLTGKTKSLLPDGSSVWIKGNGSLTYSQKALQYGEREVTMEGEAYFEVAKDTKRPFNVHVGQLTVAVTGTSFNIRESGPQVVVSLSEGSVELSCQTVSGIRLIPGQKATFDKASGQLSIYDGDVSCDACWTRPYLSFDSAPLGKICSYLSVWYGIDIIPDESLEKEYAYTFTVKDEPLEEILRIMGRINPIEYRKYSDAEYRITELNINN